jgi:hypothetical protein
MFKIIHHFGIHCSCHLQGEHVLVGHFWKYADGSGCDVTNLIGGVEEKATFQLVTSTWLRKRGDEKSLLRGMW